MNQPVHDDLRNLYGFMAEFDSAAALVNAARRAREAGYREMDAYAPFPVEELPEALDLAPSRIPLVMFGGAVAGALTGYGMQYYATAISYPMNIGGRPLPSWPALIPVTLELTILFAVFGGLAALFITLRLPAVYHPVFNVPNFGRASQDGFFLCIRTEDGRFDPATTPAFLENLQAVSVEPVPK
jgi:hypothetical protein